MSSSDKIDPSIAETIREHVRREMAANPPPPLSPDQVRLFRRLFAPARKPPGRGRR